MTGLGIVEEEVRLDDSLLPPLPTEDNSKPIPPHKPVEIDLKHNRQSSTSSSSSITQTPITSPIVTINEKFPHEKPQLNYQFNIDKFDSIDEKISYIESLKLQMKDEINGYYIAERRLIKSGWSNELELNDLKIRREMLVKNWNDIIDKLEDSIYRNNI